MAEPNNAPKKLRLDKWLWYARVVKTRSLAQKMIATGKVRVDKQKISSASFGVLPGNTLTITLERDILIYEILELGSRRGPYSEAQLLYKNLTPPKPKPKEPEQLHNGPPTSEGRPDKRQRRQLRAFKESNSDLYE